MYIHVHALRLKLSILFVAVGFFVSCSPPGIKCSEHPTCEYPATCDEGLDCMGLVGCETPICISAQQACDESCNSKCNILESYPTQIACKNKTPATP